jgi:hypothetical protein
VQGQYRDRLVDPRRRVHLDSGWRSNRIAEPTWPLLAGLLNDDPDLSGIRYLALGGGRDDWDERGGLATSEERLEREVHRIRVEPEHRCYLDADGERSDVPTARLEIRVVVAGGKIEGSLREFGLVGGDATDERDSGFLVNHVAHPRIDLARGDTLTRQVRLALRPQPRWRHAPAHWLGAQPSDVLVGIGEVYAAALRQDGVATVADVAEMEPTQLRRALPFIPLVQLRAKARLTLRTAAGLRTPAALHGHTAWDVVATPAADLADDVGVDVEEAERVREQLGALELTLNHDYLARLTVGRLVLAVRQTDDELR